MIHDPRSGIGQEANWVDSHSGPESIAAAWLPVCAESEGRGPLTHLVVSRENQSISTCSRIAPTGSTKCVGLQKKVMLNRILLDVEDTRPDDVEASETVHYPQGA